MTRWWRTLAVCGLCGAAASSACAQALTNAPRTVIAISGELTATRLSRTVAQRVGVLLQQAHAEFSVVPADTIAWLLDRVISYHPGIASMPQDLPEICRQVGATAIIDITVLQGRREYRGIAFRPVRLRRPSRPSASATALLLVGQVFASTADSVALQLVPQVVDALQRAKTDSTSATRTTVSCLDFTETSDTAAYLPRAPSNPGCC